MHTNSTDLARLPINETATSGLRVLRRLFPLSERPTEARKQVLHTTAVSLAQGGADASGRPCPTPGGALGAVLGVQIRNYGFTDLPPSLPLPRSDPVSGDAYLRIKFPPAGEAEPRIKLHV